MRSGSGPDGKRQSQRKSTNSCRRCQRAMCA